MTEKYILCGDSIRRLFEKSLGLFILNRLKIYAHRVLFVDGLTDEEWSAFHILSMSVRLARWINNEGLSGEVVAICSENRMEFGPALYGSIFSGCTVAPISPHYNESDLKHAIKITKPNLIFCSGMALEKLLNLYKDVANKPKIIVFDDEVSSNHHHFSKLSEILGQSKADEKTVYEFQIRDEDEYDKVAFIMMSSGTSGLFKGVMLTHFNVLSCIGVLTYLLRREEVAQTTPVIAVSPFTHAMGLTALYAMGGTKIIFMRKFDLKTYLEYMVKYNVADLAIPPAILYYLIQNTSVIKKLSSFLRAINLGSAPLNVDMQLHAMKRLPGVRISQAYGLTETTLICCGNMYGIVPKPGSVGTVVNGMQAKVIDDNGNVLGPNKHGELCFKGDLVMKGYVDNIKETREAIDRDGWLHTGDLGYYDDDGCFFIVDRLKELIKYKGFQVSPSEIEAILMTHLGVADAAVVGVPDIKSGELPLAFIVRKPNTSATEKEIQEFVSKQVSSTKQLRGGVRFIAEIPRNVNRKILRRVLKRMVHPARL